MTPHAPRHILVVDDQRFARQALQDILVAAGYAVLEAVDGASALAVAAASRPDLILLDITLPDMDGFAVCRSLKSADATRDIPVIFSTGRREVEVVEEAFAAGGDDFLHKPFGGAELLARLQNQLARSRAQRRLAEKARESALLLEITQALTSTLDSNDILRIIVERVATYLGVERCSMTRIQEGGGVGLVLVSSDAPDFLEVEINLERYPEIREVLRTGQTLVIDDVGQHPLMAGVSDQLQKLGFTSLLVLPVVYRCEVIGTLMLRASRQRPTFADREVRLCQLVANVSANALRNASRYEQVRLEYTTIREEKGRIEAELRAKAVFESLFEHASEGLLALNGRGEVAYINRAALGLLGLTRSDAVKLTLQGVVAEESYQEALQNHLNFFLGRPYQRRFDLFVAPRNGAKRCVSASLSEQRLFGTFCIMSLWDVTDERLQAMELREAHARLAELERIRNEFFNAATHELRTPVTIINGYLSLLRELGAESLQGAQQEYLEAAVQGAERLVELVDDLLDLSRIRAGKLELRREQRSVIDPIREVYAVLAPFASQKGQQLCLETSGDDLVACFDVERIRRVLTNLVGNALKFTPAGGRIEISATRLDGTVQVSVTDTGAGIPEEFLAQIFDEFAQAGGAGHPRGSGLGLAICKQIVEAHDGDIWVKSAPQRGSKFTFSLPVEMVSTTAPANA